MTRMKTRTIMMNFSMKTRIEITKLVISVLTILGTVLIKAGKHCTAQISVAMYCKEPNHSFPIDLVVYTLVSQ